MEKGRIQILDFLRGVSVLSMVLFHFAYDLVYLFGRQIDWYTGTPGYIWQQSICWMFILVSGASQHYTHNWIRNGFRVFACGMVVTVVTFLFMPQERILFGVLHCLGLSAMLVPVAVPLAKKVPWLGFLVSAGLFVLTRGVPGRYLGLLEVPMVEVPEMLYRVDWLFPVGFPARGFFSADYFSLVPWTFLFFTGYFGWSLVKGYMPLSSKKPLVLARVGRKSLLIYMLHQPVLYGLCLTLQRLGVL